MFIGRQNELELLKELYDSQRPEFRIVRGRRRVGKTLLLQTSIQDRKDAIFLSGMEDVTSDRKVRNRFTEKLAEFSKSGILGAASDLSWPQLFEAVQDIANRQSSLILIFDEVQWLARQGSGFLSDLKDAWTTKFQPGGKVKVVICGSSNKFFEHKTAGAETVLHKLRTMSDLWVYPMTLKETSLFCKGWSLREIVLTQMMFGGVPYYLDLLSRQERGFMQCINDVAFTAKTIFFDEVRETLKLDISSLDRALELLSVVGQDGKTMEGIARASLISVSTLDGLLGKLVDYQILFKMRPIGEPLKAKSFGVRYCLRDEFMNFFFNVIEKDKTRIRNNTKGVMIFNHVLKNGCYIENFTGKAFELIIRKIIERNLSTRLAVILAINNLQNYEVGSYWDVREKEGSQIDLVVDSHDDRCARIIEVKWMNNKVGAEKGNAIEGVLSKKFPNHKKHTIRRFVLSSSGFTKDAREFASQNKVGLISLEDIL